MKRLQGMILAPPADRLRALLDIVQRNVDVARLSDGEMAALGDTVSTIAKQPVRSSAELIEGLSALQRWFSDLTHSSGAALQVDGGSFVYLLTEDGELHRTFSGSFTVALVEEAADLLRRAGPHKLRTCPLRLRTGEVCGRLFIAERHQKYCTPPHAQIQARRESRRRERDTKGWTRAKQ